MIQDSGQEKMLKQIEIETAAFNRIIHSILKVLTEEQRERIYHNLETISLTLVRDMKDDSDNKLYNREQTIREHALRLLSHESNE
ncbi:hypothetical protein SAMN05421579_16710 [Xenorhabdus japonica]|uniref:Uncharacterized protein n=1 Tax=Xenorhabdus japonica TaxID=53341 RepID=A0A1I5EEX3_9GAMM|nr:hypothetical protein SAMN05421579_16710 [Xenorhabdus japonica]